MIVLRYAVKAGRCSVVRALLLAGALPNFEDQHCENTSLFCACSAADGDFGSDHHAAYRRDATIVRMLLYAGAWADVEVTVDAGAEDEDHLSALVEAQTGSNPCQTMINMLESTIQLVQTMGRKEGPDICEAQQLLDRGAVPTAISWQFPRSRNAVWQAWRMGSQPLFNLFFLHALTISCQDDMLAFVFKKLFVSLFKPAQFTTFAMTGFLKARHFGIPNDVWESISKCILHPLVLQSVTMFNRFVLSIRQRAGIHYEVVDIFQCFNAKSDVSMVWSIIQQFNNPFFYRPSVGLGNSLV